jgi:phosphohistidine phosphatase
MHADSPRCARRTVIQVKLYLVQHGQAKPENEDPERPLTGDGLDAVARVARQSVEQLGVRPDRVVHSGKTRARQTAEVWGRLVNVDAEQADAPWSRTRPSVST